MYAVTRSKMIDGKFWRRNIKWSVLVIVIFGAAITPDGSGITMWFVAGPLIGLYLIGIFLSERHANSNEMPRTFSK